MANTTVESLIQKFAESKGTGKERPGKMIDSARRHTHISHSVTSVFAFKLQNGAWEIPKNLCETSDIIYFVSDGTLRFCFDLSY